MAALTTHFRSLPSGVGGTQEPLIFRSVFVAEHECHTCVFVLCLFKNKKKILIQGRSEQAEMTSGESCFTKPFEADCTVQSVCSCAPLYCFGLIQLTKCSCSRCCCSQGAVKITISAAQTGLLWAPLSEFCAACRRRHGVCGFRKPGLQRPVWCEKRHHVRI